ncbi:MAG: Xaa-Pro aminopeptidase [Bacteroidales bacterium]|nr:Xaa-Pro aminopeptidase [Bacteroidales bacterium]
MFYKDTYISRRARLVSLLSGEKGLAIFLGNADSPQNYPDNCYRFRQDSTFLYFWGIDEPLFAATIDLESGKETIYGDDVDIDDIIWMGPQPSVASRAETVGVHSTAPYNAFFETVRSARKAGRPVHFLPASRHYNAGCLADLLGLSPRQVVSDGKKGCANASAALVKAVISMRLIKEDCEIEEIDKACDITYEMHTAARRGCRAGVPEQELVGRMEGVTLSKGWGTSFSTILSQHGETLHNPWHNAVLEDGKLLLVDAGAENNMHYAGDFTRTFPVSGKFTSKQKDIYNIVLSCNELAFEMAGPGKTYTGISRAVALNMLEGLKGLGLVEGNTGDMLEADVAGLFMPHGLGHNMGLDVHDMEDFGENLEGYDPGQARSPLLGLGSLRMARELRPGHVFTDEPGIYFIPALIEHYRKNGIGKDFIRFDRLESYKDFGGIRIEDDVLVMEYGARRLGRYRLPATVEEVEEDMKQNK